MRKRGRTASVCSVLALLLIGAGVLPGAGAQESHVEGYRAHDESLLALNILPPGQGRFLNALEFLQAQTTGDQPSQNTDQLDMYDSLIQGAQDLTADSLTDFFKDASFGVKPDDVTREYSPRDGVTILRDTFQVPHVYGKTRGDTMFGAGYVSAEDRLFMMDVLRHVGRARLSEFLGGSPSNLAMDAAIFRKADYTEEELQGMIDRGPKVDPVLGPLAVGDVESFAEGVNAYIDEVLRDPNKLPAEYPALQQLPQPWKPTDTVAVATVIGGQFGSGGGGELAAAKFLEALEAEGYSPGEAREVMDDFRFWDDPEAPTHAERSFPYNLDLGRVNPRAVGFPDDAQDAANSLPVPPTTIDGPFGPIPLALPMEASSAVLIGSNLSSTGHPMAVFGPQVGYWSPEILNEIDLHGPGIRARGVGFPGISMYVLLGRGDGYAWSATSSDGDLEDIIVEELCDPEGGAPTEDSTFYLADGECLEMYSRTETFVAKPSAGGPPSPEQAPGNIVVTRTTHRTDEGIVQARGTVNGKPVAFVLNRSTYMAEVDSALAFVEIMDPERINGAADFQRAFSRFNFTFNWLYVDGKDIAYQHTGDMPLRHKGVDPALPVWGNGDWGWRGFMADDDKATSVSPPKGYISSWNNKIAPGFVASDENWGYGPLHRSLLLDDRVRAASGDDGKVDLIELVQAMADAATVDLRGDKVLPLMLEVIGTPDQERLREAAGLLRAWYEDGAHRRDLDEDGAYEHSAAVALMDAWWDPALDAAFGPALGEAIDDVPLDRDNEPGPVGSSYITGWYGQLHKDLRTLLGLPVTAAFSRGYCGAGSLPACRDDLTASLDEAVSALEEQYGQDPADWDADEAGDQIQFVTLGVQGQRPMQWQNRPTFQQVVEFGPPPRGAERRSGAAGGPEIGGSGGGDASATGSSGLGVNPGSLAATGWNGLRIAALGLVLFSAGVALVARDCRRRLPG